ncbi:MAG: HAD family hydrolase [Myxococcota bacterium]|nr:HAD family hydrolase [Myxococcota bacterium]
MKPLIILDFDGTMTDAEAEGKPYSQGYLEDLALICNLSNETIAEWAQEFTEHVQKNQQRFGWKFNGDIVAPASVDPYLRIMPVARMILDRANLLTDTSLRDRILDRILYKYNYQKTNTCFRDGAAEFLSQFNETKNCYIVTNSHTEPVRQKVKRLSEAEPNLEIEWLIDRVSGSAKKYVIDEKFDSLPHALTLPNLQRPILLRRSNYFSVLERIRKQENRNWSDMIVIGDIFELDLSVPISMGAHVGLMTSQFTPDYEREYLVSHPRGAVFTSLPAASQWLRSI